MANGKNGRSLLTFVFVKNDIRCLPMLICVISVLAKEDPKDPRAKKNYKKVQQEIGAVLGDPSVPSQLPGVFVQQPK